MSRRYLCGAPGLSVVSRCDSAGTLRLLIQADVPPATDPRLASTGYPVTVSVWLSDTAAGNPLTSTGADSIALGPNGSNLTVGSAGKAVSVQTDSKGKAEIDIASAAHTLWFVGVSSPSGSAVSPQLIASDWTP